MLCDEHDEHFYRNLILSVQREERDVLRAQVARSRAAARTLGGSQRLDLKTTRPRPQQHGRGRGRPASRDRRPRDMGRRRTGLAAGAWPEDSEDTEWLEVPEADLELHAGLSVSFEDEHESQLALEGEGSWDQDADYEAGLALEDMGLLEEDAEFAVAGYASTDSEDLLGCLHG